MKCIPSPRISLLVPPPSVLKTMPRFPDSTVGQRQPGRNGATASEQSSTARRIRMGPPGTAESLAGRAPIHHRERPFALEHPEERVERREEEEPAARERPEQRDLGDARGARRRE